MALIRGTGLWNKFNVEKTHCYSLYFSDNKIVYNIGSKFPDELN
jgi:hypothetical protein